MKLGLFPGWGGTARVPRIVGLSNAVELISTGENTDGKGAVAMGLGTDVVPAEDLLSAAIALCRAEQESGDFRRDREQWSAPIDIDEASNRWRSSCIEWERVLVDALALAGGIQMSAKSSLAAGLAVCATLSLLGCDLTDDHVATVKKR